MPTGARLSVLLMFAFACVSGTYAKPKDEIETFPARQIPNESNAGIAVSVTIHANELDRANKEKFCRSGIYSTNDDLCAQWKAADAARDAADWAKWSFLLGIAGTFGLLATLYYTRKAVVAAEEAAKDADDALQVAQRNADAAHAHVEVARQTAERQLRAYIHLESGNIKSQHRAESQDNAVEVTYTLNFKNSGQTPAKNVLVSSNSIYDEYPMKGVIKDFESPDDAMNVGPGSEFLDIHTALFDNRMITNVHNGTHAIYVIVSISYTDVFDKIRHTNLCVYSNGSDYDNGRLKPYKTGNSAT